MTPTLLIWDHINTEPFIKRFDTINNLTFNQFGLICLLLKPPMMFDISLRSFTFFDNR